MTDTASAAGPPAPVVDPSAVKEIASGVFVICDHETPDEADALDSQIELNPLLNAAVQEFATWWNEKQGNADKTDKITSPLYHYTDAGGLKGIVEDEELWFTSIFHLNDPSEHKFGLRCAISELKNACSQQDEPTRYFGERLEKSILSRDIEPVFGFFVVSFSQDADDLGQWRAYGDNGRGFCVGLAPKLFQPEEKKNVAANEAVFVAKVSYGEQTAKQRQRECIEKAVSIIRATLTRPEVQQIIEADDRQGHKFIGHMCIEVAAPILWNSLISKHRAYENEKEVRLVIPCSYGYSDLKVETRVRGGELIPFVRSPMPVRARGNIVKVMVGPAAAASARDAAKSLLRPFIDEPNNVVDISEIPYRAR